MELRARAYQVQENEVKVHASIAVDAEQRFPANLCLVIDVSGSMQLPAVLKDQEASELSILDIVVHSCRTVIHSLSAEDQLGIVTYSDAAEVKLALTAMDAAGKAAAEAALQTLRADGQTNLWQGLESALDLLRSATSSGRISSALLLTDGVPNVEPVEGHLAALRRYQEASGKLPCTLHTFGFGYDLDSQLLDQLSQAAGGIYVFIPDAGFVGTALVNCTGTAVTALGRNAQLTLTTEGTSCTSCTSCRALGYGERKGTVELGSIQLGQSKDVILDLKFVARPERLKLHLEFDGPAGSESHELDVDLQSLPTELSEECSLQSWRLQVVEMTQKLLGLKEEELPGAQQRVEDFLCFLRSATTAGADERLSALLEDVLEDVDGQVREAVSRQDWYQSWGAHYLRSLSRAHLAQVCNNFKDPGVQHYGGNLFHEVRDAADEIFLKLPPPNPATRSNVELLMAMGFPEDEVQRALEYAYDNVEQAATYLMEGMPAHRPAVRPVAHHPHRTVDMRAYYDASGG